MGLSFFGVLIICIVCLGGYQEAFEAEFGGWLIVDGRMEGGWGL